MCRFNCFKLKNFVGLNDFNNKKRDSQGLNAGLGEVCG